MEGGSHQGRTAFGWEGSRKSGSSVFGAFVRVVEGDWPSMPNIFGAYAGVPKVGAITKHEHYRQTLGAPLGDIHFTGTETSEHWAGYIEGAMLSAYRTGEEVAAKLMG